MATGKKRSSTMRRRAMVRDDIWFYIRPCKKVAVAEFRGPIDDDHPQKHVVIIGPPARVALLLKLAKRGARA